MRVDQIQSTAGLLQRIPLFSGCTDRELEHLAGCACAIAFEPGDVLCAAGADAPECYVVAEGEARVSIGAHTVAVVGAEDVVGERGPILNRPRAATVTALTPMVTYAIPREELRALADSNPAAAAAMRDELLRRYG